MNHAFSLTQGMGSGGGALRVLGPAFAGRLTTSRAGAALALDANGNYQTAAPNTPRFTGFSRRLLVEEARTNTIRNPRGEGMNAGSPGVTPIYWSVTPTAGMSRGLGGGMDRGIPYISVRCSGAATTAGYFSIGMEELSWSTAAHGQTYTFSIDIRVADGVLPAAANFRIRLQERGGSSSPASDKSFVPTTAWQRVTVTRNVSLADTTSLVPSFLPYFMADTGIDLTLQIAAPQLEMGGAVSSLCMPPAGSPATSNRAVDLPVWAPPGGFGGQGTIVVKAMLPQSAPFGASQGLWQIDDGSDANRIQLRNTSAGAAITGVVDVAGATLATLSGGNMAPGTPFRAAFTWAAGDQALCLAGGTVQSAAVALPPGLARMLVGHGSTLLNRAANGEVELVDYRPARIPNALLQALANAG